MKELFLFGRARMNAAVCCESFGIIEPWQKIGNMEQWEPSR